MLEVCDLPFDFDFYRGLQLSDWMNLRKDFELWTFNVETTVDYRTFEVGLMYFALWLGMAP
jgi:hypothetical protein